MLRAVALLCFAPACPGLLCKGSREIFIFDMCRFGMHDRKGSILDIYSCYSRTYSTRNLIAAFGVAIICYKTMDHGWN